MKQAERNYRTKPQPVCRCGVPMLVYCTRGAVRYCKCPKCGETKQQTR